MKDNVSMQAPLCPLPIRRREAIILGHGSGGKLTHDLIRDTFQAYFRHPALLRGDDAALLALPDHGTLALCTDAHIVSPLIFPGGDIGRLAVCGTVNDLVMVGARPLALTASFILEEGLPASMLETVLASMRAAADEAGIDLLAGDTKVAERGKADGIFISSSGLGLVPEGRNLSGANARPGDRVIVSGSLGDHGIAVLAARGELAFEAEVRSDVAPLNALVEAMFDADDRIHVLRDPTRGGLATTLNEIAAQSQVSIQLQEDCLPVNPAVDAACEMLGYDPLYVANEGKLIAIVDPAAAESVLEAMRAHTYGRQAQIIGRVEAGPAGRVTLVTALGGTRLVDVLAGELLPRIC